MKIQKTVIIFLAVLCALFFVSCKDNIVQPPDDGSVQMTATEEDTAEETKEELGVPQSADFWKQRFFVS